MTIVFYVSGHGFGHASRQAEVMRHLRLLRPDDHIVVRSAVPRWFIERIAPPQTELHTVEIDTGVVQVDSLELDDTLTAERAEAFYANFPARVDAEAKVLLSLGASLIVGDIPPLAFAAGHRARVRSIAIGNFTWDWIYAGYPQFETLAPGVLRTIRIAYSNATLALRLPFPGGFEPMQDVTSDIPLVARRSRLGRDDARRALDLGEGRPIVLASFGGHGIRLPYEQIAQEYDITLVVTDHEIGVPGTVTAGKLRSFSGAELAARDIRYEDLVAAADVVVTKPGYGIVSECIANDTAMLYTSRGHFVEHDVLISTMPRFLKCRFIAQEDLRAGHWGTALDALIEQPPPPERMDVNGAAIAAAKIDAELGE